MSLTITSTSSDIDIGFTPNTNGTYPISGHMIERNVNNNGWNEGKDLTSSSYLHDDGGGWGSPVGSVPTFPDFLANGTMYNFRAVAYTAINGTTVYDSGYCDYSYTDNNDGQPFTINHYGTFTGTYHNTTKIIMNNSTAFFGTSPFNQGSDTFSSGDVTVTPTTYGIQANGSALNFNFDFINKGSVSGKVCYSQIGRAHV